MLLRAHQIFDGETLGGPATLHVEGDRVAEVVRGEPGQGDAGGARGLTEDGPGAGAGEVTTLPEGWVLAPGLVDVHCHGGGGASFSDEADGIEQVLATHRAAGTTSTIASTVTESVDDLCARAGALRPFVDSGEILGVHLEGPWLNALHKGAHDATLLRAPDVVAFDRVQAAAGGGVRMVTLAPELEGAAELVEHLLGEGVVVAVGHTDATYAASCAAFDAGATVATHLFNGMRGIHHRDPGPAVAAMERPDVWIELIADGVHLHAATVRSVMRLAGRRAVLITDAMSAAGQPDGDYRLGGLAVRVTDGVARLVEGGAIAGSTLVLADAVRYAIGEAGVEAEGALRAATSAPAAMVGAGDGIGHLRAGGVADAVVLDEAWRVRGVLRRGGWLVRPDC